MTNTNVFHIDQFFHGAGHTMAYNWIVLLVWVFLAAASVMALFPRSQWKIAVIVFWFAAWVPVITSLTLLIFHIGFSQKPGIADHYNTFWTATLKQNTFLFALFAAIIRFIAEKNIDALEERRGGRLQAFFSRLISDGWLLWLLLVTYFEWKFPDPPHDKLLAINRKADSLFLAVIFILTGWLWLYTTLRYRFVKQEAFVPAVLRGYLFSWCRTPLQIFLMGPKQSGKSRLFSACTARKHVKDNDRPQKDTYRDRLPRDFFHRLFSRQVIISIIDPPGEQLGLHLHCAKLLRTDNLVLCFHIESFDRKTLSDAAFSKRPDGFLACVASKNVKEYLHALNFAINGDPQTFKISRITVFIDCQLNENGVSLPSAGDLDGLRVFAKSVGSKLGIVDENQFLFIGKANDPSQLYFHLGKGEQGKEPMFLRTFIAAVASSDV